MKCPGCGYQSSDSLETCKRCGTPMVAGSVEPAAATSDTAEELLALRFDPKRSAPGPWFPGRGRFRAARGSRVDSGGDFVEMLDDDAIEVGEDDLDGVLAAGTRAPDRGADPPFRLDDDIFLGMESGGTSPPAAAPAAGDVTRLPDWMAAGAELPEPVFEFSGEAAGTAAFFEPIIDRSEDVPERFWAPEVAGLGRRALALLVDQSLLALVLGAFFLGALLALKLNDLDTDLLLDAAGLQASALPFALLAAVLSFAGALFFHGSSGRTPGKALAGIEVRTSDGRPLTWGRAALRWIGAVFALGCAGVGIFWALFEPRRRGWADLISGTVVARPRHGSGTEVSRG